MIAYSSRVHYMYADMWPLKLNKNTFLTLSCPKKALASAHTASGRPVVWRTESANMLTVAKTCVHVYHVVGWCIAAVSIQMYMQMIPTMSQHALQIYALKDSCVDHWKMLSYFGCKSATVRDSYLGGTTQRSTVSWYSNIQIHSLQPTFMCPRSIAGVPFDSVRRFQASLLLRTTCMHLCCNWVASCVVA